MSAFVNSVAVGATTTTIIAASPGASKATVQWISGDDVHLSFGTDALANKGITMGSTGILIYEVPLEFLRAGVNGICTSAAVVQTAGI